MTTCLGPVVNLVVLFCGYASIGMVSSTLAISFFTRILYFLYVRFKLNLKPTYKNMPTKLLGGIMKFSLWVFVSDIVNQLYNVTDSVIIGAIPGLGAAAVSIYSVGTVFSNIISSLATTISSLLAPKVNKMVFSKASRRELSNFVTRIGRIQAFIIFLAVSGFIALGKPFIEFYAGESYAEAYYVAVFIMVPGCIPLVQSVALSMTVAENKHRFRAITYLIIAIINVIGTYIVLRYTNSGIESAALVTGIAGIIGPGLLMNWFYVKKMHLEILNFWKNIIKLLYVPASLCALTLFLSKYIDFSYIPFFIICVILYVFLYCLLTWFFVMNQEEKSLITSTISSVFRKFKK